MDYLPVSAGCPLSQGSVVNICGRAHILPFPFQTSSSSSFHGAPSLHPSVPRASHSCSENFLCHPRPCEPSPLKILADPASSLPTSPDAQISPQALGRAGLVLPPQSSTRSSFQSSSLCVCPPAGQHSSLNYNGDNHLPVFPSQFSSASSGAPCELAQEKAGFI